MPAKKNTRGQKIDVTTLFSNKETQEENSLDWASGHNYDEPDPTDVQAGRTRPGVTKDDRHVAGTKAASFGNFRDEGQKQCGVAPDMPPPYVCFVKTFGRGVTEEIMRSYFPDSEILNVLLINNERALYCLIEFGQREDLAKSLMVTGAKIMYQHPCTVDIASPEQVEKMQNFAARKNNRSGGRSPTSPNNRPNLNFDRDAFQSQTAPEGDFNDDGEEGGGGEGGRNNGGRGGRGGFKGMSRSVSNNLLDGGRDALFGSADPVPPPAENADGGADGHNKKPGRFGGGNRIAVSTASAEFSRDAVFGTAAPSSNSTNQSPGASPNPSGRPQFGRNSSMNSIGNGSEGENGSDHKQTPKEFSRDMFGGADVPPPPTTTTEGGEADEKQQNGGGRRGNNNGRGENRGGGGGDRFSRRSPVSNKESNNGDAGDRFGNFRKDNSNNSNNNGAATTSKAATAGSWRS